MSRSGGQTRLRGNECPRVDGAPKDTEDRERDFRTPVAPSTCPSAMAPIRRRREVPWPARARSLAVDPAVAPYRFSFARRTARRAMLGTVGGRPGLRRLLVSYFLAGSPRCQASSVAGVTGRLRPSDCGASVVPARRTAPGRPARTLSALRAGAALRSRGGVLAVRHLWPGPCGTPGREAQYPANQEAGDHEQTRPANRHCVQAAGDCAGQPRNRVFGRHRIRVRPQFGAALALAREIKGRAPHCRVIVTVCEMKRLGRDTAELTALAGHLTAHGLVLEMLAGPLPGMYDPPGPGRLRFAFFAAMAGTGRENIRESTPGRTGRRCPQGTEPAGLQHLPRPGRAREGPGISRGDRGGSRRLRRHGTSGRRHPAPAASQHPPARQRRTTRPAPVTATALTSEDLASRPLSPVGHPFSTGLFAVRAGFRDGRVGDLPRA